MKYPYIGINEQGTKVLFFSSNSQNVLLSGDSTALVVGCSYESIKSDFYKNITNEYLQNTYGKVQSPQHAEFIIELAKNAGFEHEDYEDYDIRDNYFYFSGDYLGFTDLAVTASSDGEKQITIPLPPKDDKQESSEWPQVGDEAVLVSMGMTMHNKPVRLTYIGDGVGCYVDLTNGMEYTYAKRETVFKKPKTPEEELRDDIVKLIDDADGLKPKVLARALMCIYNITKKV